MVHACAGRWQLKQVRPFVPRSWKNGFVVVERVRRGDRALDAAAIRERQLIGPRLVSRGPAGCRQEGDACQADRKHRLHCFPGVHRLPLTQLVRKKVKMCRGAG